MIGERHQPHRRPAEGDGRRATYTAEWPIERLAYGVIVESTIARGTIAKIDTAAACARSPACSRCSPPTTRRAPPDKGRAGVNPPAGRVLSLLQDREVRYNGEPIALVVAETFEQATYAASLVQATYDAGDSGGRHGAELPKAEPVTEKIFGQFEPASQRGDVDTAPSPALDVVIDGAFTDAARNA